MFGSYEDLISINNLLKAWKGFLSGKKNKPDVQIFERYLMNNIISLHHDLKNQTYKHGGYKAFKINDPKPRQIHKASVRDRVVHHAIYRSIYWLCDRKFIHDSYSCRLGKGTHKAIERFEVLVRKVSKNHTQTAWVLKCDIKKFFASIDQGTLKQILPKHVKDEKMLGLLDEIIDSFHSGTPGRGLPLGNLTSQILVNIYMNEFDQFVKHKLRIKYYIRYADDFVFMSDSKTELERILPRVKLFLEEKLKMQLHPNKVFIKTIASGVDFLGWVHFTDHRVLRSATKRRMFKKLSDNPSENSVYSYLGMLAHGNARELQERVRLLQGER